VNPTIAVAAVVFVVAIAAALAATTTFTITSTAAQAHCPGTGVFQVWTAVDAMAVAPCCGRDNPLKSPW